jgi:hypothetical protein
MTDSLYEMLSELRRTCPPIYLADEFAAWRAAVGQVIAAYPTEERFLWTVTVAQDLERRHGVVLPAAFRWVQESVEAQGVRT